MTTITVYSTTWCGDCRNLKRFFAEEGIEYSEIDIDQNESAAQQVIAWSGGKRVIPTLHITKDKDSPVILHNPKLHDLQDILKRMNE